MEDLDLMEELCGNIFGRSFCALGDALTSPINSSLQHFRGEYEEHVVQGRCPLGITEPRPREQSSYAPQQFERRVAAEPAGQA
jgi:NADH-quinone oxidoreductase subunit F